MEPSTRSIGETPLTCCLCTVAPTIALIQTGTSAGAGQVIVFTSAASRLAIALVTYKASGSNSATTILDEPFPAKASVS
jgi:hypothetical protein